MESATLEVLERISAQLEKQNETLLAMAQSPVYTIQVGTIWDLLNAPVEGFSPEFVEKLQAFAVEHLRAKPVTKKQDNKESGNYKKTKQIIIPGQA